MPGKRLVRSMLAHVAHVEIDGALQTRLAFAHAFAGDGAGDHVARGQFEQRVVALHEALAAVVAQIRAFAAQGFGEEEARRAGKRERGGMELIELHVGEFGAGMRRPARCRRRWRRRDWWCRSRPGLRRRWR